MKLFSAFVAVALAGKNDPNKGGQDSDKNPPGTCSDKNTMYLDGLSAAVTDSMTDMHGADSLEEKWRIKLRRQRDQLCASAKRDYCGRLAQGNCDANKVHEFKKTDDVFDIKEKELPEDCKGNADVESIQAFGRAAARWVREWNFVCDPTWKKRKHKRLIKRIKALRASAYTQTPQPGCSVAGWDPQIEDWKWKW